MSGSPAPPGTASSWTLARVRGPGGATAPGGTSSIVPVTSSSPSSSRARTRRNPAPTPPRAAATSPSAPPRVHEEHDAAVARDRGLDRCERSAQRRRLPAPRRADRAAGERLDREDRRGVATEDPGRGPVRERESLLVRTDRRLAEDEPDPAGRIRGRPAAPALAPLPSPAPSDPGRRRAGDAEDCARGPVGEAADVLAETRLDGAHRAALESLDEAADEPDAVLEREPRVALAPAARCRAGGRGRPGSGASRSGPGSR